VQRRTFGARGEDGENCTKSSFRILQFTKYWGDEVEEDEMADKCNGGEGGDKCLQKCYPKT
jgi:hypothetical protein